MSESDFYLVDYAGADMGLPVFISGDYNVDEWEWDEFDPNADKVKITKTYKFKIADKKIKKIGSDFLGFPHNIVSEEFLSLCKERHVRCLAVPVKVMHADDSVPEKKYYIFSPLEAVQLMDSSKSNYGFDKDIKSGDVIYNKYHPAAPAYGWIKRFYNRENVDVSFFLCIELMKWVCSQNFKEAAEKRLTGFSFMPIDSSFVFDPWGEMP